MKLNTDRITTLSGGIFSIATGLATVGVYPQYTGLAAAIAGSVTAFYTNKK